MNRDNPSSMSAAIERAQADLIRRALASDAQALTRAPQVARVYRIALARAPNPDQAALYFERLVGAAAGSLAHAFVTYQRIIETLVTVFSGSQFLGEILVRAPELVADLGNLRALAPAKSAEQFHGEALKIVSDGASPDQTLDALRRWQRRELLRIGSADLLGLLDLPTVTAQLSRLADSLIQACLRLAAQRTSLPTDGLAVIALGKLGGGELNYSSDIDLTLIAADDPSNRQRLAAQMIDALTRATAEGFLYRVDMRLRPWGSSGPLVVSIDSHLSYLQRHARLWEKQAFLKARVAAGDESVGRAFLDRAAPLLFGSDPEAVRADVLDMKRRIEAELRRRGREWGEVKLGVGSIRDVEFVTQYLQLIHGAERPELRCANTLEALTRLYTTGLLSVRDYRILADGYTFLRPVEHYLQLMAFQQTHSLPEAPGEIAYLARRLGFQGEGAGAEFLAHYEQHSAAIRAVYQWYLEGVRDNMPNDVHEPLPSAAHRHLARMDPSYAAVFSSDEIAHHAEMAERLSAANLVELDALPQVDGDWRVTVVAFDYPGELSLICGLLFGYGFSIRDGHVFTYEPMAPNGEMAHSAAQRKIVDVFTVHPVREPASRELWSRYAYDLAELLARLSASRANEAHGELARRVAEALRRNAGAVEALTPVDITIDNDASADYTVLYIEAPDTTGFLYEFTNALALTGHYVARVTVNSVGNRVQDTFYLQDHHGRKIEETDKQRELRAATVLVKHFTHLLPHSPNPELALLHFREFIGELFARPAWPDELASLERPQVLTALARLLGVSDFLWDDFLRMQHANLFPVVRDVDDLAIARPRAQLEADLRAALAAAPGPAARRAALNAWKDREMFRVDMRHIQGHITRFGAFSAALTDVAELAVGAAYQMCYDELLAQHGAPHLADGRPCPMTVCALGKCGGRELGYASDIELMFIYAGAGETDGHHPITNGEFYNQLVSAFLGAIQARREGIFEVDLRLRPYGSAGSLAVSLDAFRRYFGPGGPAWPYERQALVKLRPIAGDEVLGHEIAALRDALIYTDEGFDLAAMRAMRERQLRHLVTAGTTNAKFSPGGLVDIEYLVQALQIKHGYRNPALRLTNTREAMAALAEAGILSPRDFTRLRDAHRFIRRLIDALRMVRGNARDLTTPPADSADFDFLARRLGYEDDPARLSDDLVRHTVAVQEIAQRALAN